MRSRDGARHRIPLATGQPRYAATGILAIGAAFAQALWIDDPVSEIITYLGLWVATTNRRRHHQLGVVAARAGCIPASTDENEIYAAAEQLLPAIVGGITPSGRGQVFHFSSGEPAACSGLWQNRAESRRFRVVPLTALCPFASRSRAMRYFSLPPVLCLRRARF